MGTSGYQYDHWKKRFYPEDLSKKHWFAHYAQYFDTVEINNTFYRLPSAKPLMPGANKRRRDFVIR